MIFMDVQMPEMGGMETTAAIRAKEAQQGSHIPIIAMTAHALKGDRERCIAAGMDDYRAKPIKRDELLAVILRNAPASSRSNHESERKTAAATPQES
jgi:CheY-like chemotaxis protein